MTLLCEEDCLTCPALQNANLSDVLMDRAVLNEANLRNANFQRAVLTRLVALIARSWMRFMQACKQADKARMLFDVHNKSQFKIYYWMCLQE